MHVVIIARTGFVWRDVVSTPGELGAREESVCTRISEKIIRG